VEEVKKAERSYFSEGERQGVGLREGLGHIGGREVDIETEFAG